MKVSTFVFAILLMLAVGASAQNEAFDPSGNYHPVAAPAGDDQFVQINLRLRRTSRGLSAAGEVRNTGRWNHFTTTDVNEKRVLFRTASLQGIHYEFDGRFTGTGNFGRRWSGNGVVMLKGSLRKFVRGRLVESLTSDFVFYPLH